MVHAFRLLSIWFETMFAVVVCSRCNRAMGVDLRNKTAVCTCGSRILLKQAKKYFESASQREIAQAVQQINKSLAVGEDEFPAGRKTAKERTKTISGQGESRFGKLMKELKRISEHSDFITTRDLKKAISLAGIEDSDKALQSLLELGVIYQPKAGFYRLV